MARSLRHGAGDKRAPGEAGARSLDLDALEVELRDGVSDVFFQPEAQFKPLLHVVEVLAAEAVSGSDEEGGGGGGGGSAVSPELTRSRRSGIVTASMADPTAPPPPPVPAAPSCWMTLHTLAGKELPLPGIGPSDTVGDVMAACLKKFGCAATGADGEAGLYSRGSKLFEPATPLKALGLPLPPKRASLVLQNKTYEDLCRQASVVDGVVDAFLAAHYSTLSSSVHAIGQVRSKEARRACTLLRRTCAR